MIFESLTLHNFQRYGGSSTIHFPPAENRSLVLLLAPNNTGKTTILRALDFLFYGSLSSETSATCWKLITEVEREKVAPGAEISAWVEGVIRFANNEVVTLRRLIKAKLSASGEWQAFGPKLYFKKNSAFVADQEDYYQSKIDNVVPKNLFSWFYFQGEPADGKIGTGNHPGLLEPLKKVIQLRRWSDARANVAEILKSLKLEEAKAAGANKDYLDKRRKHDIIKKNYDENRNELTQCHSDLAILNEKYRALEREREQVSQQALESQELFKKQSAQQQLVTQAKNSIDSADQEIRRLLKERMGIPLLQSAFDCADKHLSELRARNLLPADVSKGFIERLIKSRQCVCGSCIDDAKLAELQQYLGQTLAAQTNRDLVALADSLDGGSESWMRQKAKTFQNAQAKLVGLKADACKKLSNAEDILDNIKSKIQQSAIEQFVKLSKEVNIIQQEISINERQQRSLETIIKQQHDLLGELTNDLKKAQPKKGDGELAKTAQAIQVAENLQTALHEGEAKFKESVHQTLQSRLSHYFGVATSGNVAWVDRDSFLPTMKDRNGYIVRNPGGGEQQVLNLAFVVALVELRNVVNTELRSAGLGTSLLGDQSFFLDSPFTSADPNFMLAIAKFLPGKTSQMMLLLAKQNWTDAVRAALEPRIEMAYGTTLHTSVEPEDPEAFVFRWKKKEHKLISKLPAGETSYSTFQQL